LYDQIPDHVNLLDDGVTTRKDAFVHESQVHDPVRSVGANPSPHELEAVTDYATRLKRTESVVESEIERLIDDLDAELNVRTKGPEGVIDKVQRMVNGGPGRPPRPDYKVGDVIDAIGARITVKDTADLGTLIEKVRNHFGFGDEGRILEVENMYAAPKSRNPAYRVIPMIIKVEHGGHTYTFELQLTTKRASIAADLNHNTVYKPHIDATPAEQAKVTRMFEEAAALEQIESRGLNNG
jgi:ppGpp synthetase/RelA/SpoT-type nucleotidyltranferase